MNVNDRLFAFASELDSVSFGDSVVADFFSLVHYILGTPLYSLVVFMLAFILIAFVVAIVLAGYRIINPFK